VLFLTAKENTYFLGCYSKPSSKLSFPWGVIEFSWRLAAKEMFDIYFGDSDEKNNDILKVSKNPKI
jgi:hypothetical protein